MFEVSYYWLIQTKIQNSVLNLGLVAPKMQVTLNHEYLDPEVHTYKTLTNLKW